MPLVVQPPIKLYMHTHFMPTVNHYLGRSRLGRVYKKDNARSFQHKLMERFVCKYPDFRPINKGKIYIKVMFRFKDRRRRDNDNYMKCIKDALNGFAYDDDSRIWKEKSVRLEPKRGRRRHKVMIRITQFQP